MNRHLSSLLRRLALGVMAFGIVGGFPACGAKQKEPSIDAKEQEKARAEAVIVDTAYQEAHRSVQDFIVELGTTRADYRYLVKMRVQQDDEAEYLWVEPANYQNGTFFGPVANDPAKVTAVKKGDVIKARVRDIFDWVILDQSDKLVAGGFTQKVAERQRAKRKP